MKLTEYSTEKIFERLLNNKSGRNHWTGVSELRKRKTDAIFKKSLELIASEVLKKKIIGIDILSQFGFPRLHQKKILNLFFKLLKTEQDKMVLASVLYGIGHNNNNLTQKQVGLMCTFKSHKSAYVRYALVFALCAVENTNAIDTLIELSRDRDAEIRDWATFGIGSQIETDNDKIRQTLWARTTDRDETVRHEAIAGLAQRKDDRIKPILASALEDIDEYGSLVLESIEAFNDKDFIPLLEKRIEINKTTNQINEKWLINTLDKLKETAL